MDGSTSGWPFKCAGRKKILRRMLGGGLALQFRNSHKGGDPAGCQLSLASAPGRKTLAGAEERFPRACRFRAMLILHGTGRG